MMNVYGLTDRGLVREVNEDCIGIASLNNGITIAVVCDGMGGAAGGQVASSIAEEAFISSMSSLCNTQDGTIPDGKKIKSALKKSVEKANSAVLAHANEDLSLFGMGCTLVAAVAVKAKSKLYFANIGDSRLYMITKKSIKQLSKDHSYVQMLVDNKEISPEEAECHPKKNLITKAIGIRNDIEPDISNVKIPKKGDTYFLLCSDGLHGLVSKDALSDVALSRLSIPEKVFTYIKLANDAGGVDNISAILISSNETEGD